MPNLTIGESNWLIDGNTLKKRFHYKGLLNEDSEHIIGIDIDTSPNAVTGGYHSHVSILIKPSIFLNTVSGFLVAQLAAGEAARQSARKGGLNVPAVVVRVGKADDGTLILQPNTREDTHVFLDAIGQGERMSFVLQGQNGLFAQIPIPNDKRYLEMAKMYFSHAAEKLATKDSMLSDLANVKGSESVSGVMARWANRLMGRWAGKTPVSTDDTLVMQTTQGRVVIELRPDLAPNHVARIKELVRLKWYDGVVFHRVIDGFMAQTGDPTGTGRGGSGHNLKAEFSNEPHVRGTVSMARANHPDSADSQFFICFDDATFLDGKYTVWGKVIEGMENIDRLKRGEPVEDPDKIITLRIGEANESAEAQSDLCARPSPGNAKLGFRVIKVTENSAGKPPTLHIEPPPLSHDNFPEVSEELARIIAPYFKDCDNVGIGFMSFGLPTTTLAILSPYDVADEPSRGDDGDDTRSWVTFEVRIMIFEAPDGKTGANFHLRPARQNSVLGGYSIGQDIVGARTYEFREKYQTSDEAMRDLDRLARIAHRQFREDRQRSLAMQQTC